MALSSDLARRLALVLLALGASAQDMSSSFTRGKPVLLSSGADANLAITDGNGRNMRAMLINSVSNAIHP